MGVCKFDRDYVGKVRKYAPCGQYHWETLKASLESACRGSLCWLDSRFEAGLPVSDSDWRLGRSPQYERLTGRTTHNGVGRRSQAGLSLLEDIDSSTGGLIRAVLSRDLVAHERSLSFTYGRPVESWSNLEQMYFGKRRASRINLFWSL